jgi:hypothetical protein
MLVKKINLAKNKFTAVTVYAPIGATVPKQAEVSPTLMSVHAK